MESRLSAGTHKLLHVGSTGLRTITAGAFLSGGHPVPDSVVLVQGVQLLGRREAARVQPPTRVTARLWQTSADKSPTLKRLEHTHSGTALEGLSLI